jgi:hypothetical protein
MRTRAIVTAVFLAATLTACGGDDDTSGSDGATSEASSDVATDDTTTQTEPSPPEETESSESTSGGSSGSDYCDELKSARSALNGLDPTRLGDDQFDDLTDQLGDLAEAAPAAVKDEWLTVSDTLTRVKDILADAGLTFGDLQNLDPTNLPDGVTVKDLERLGTKLQEFALDTDFQKAATEIGRNAKAACGVSFLD